MERLKMYVLEKGTYMIERLDSLFCSNVSLGFDIVGYNSNFSDFLDVMELLSDVDVFLISYDFFCDEPEFLSMCLNNFSAHSKIFLVASKEDKECFNSKYNHLFNETFITPFTIKYLLEAITKKGVTK